MPDLNNPTQLRVALGFGALYALVLVGSAWLTSRVGNEGLYGLAVVSGLVDIDAITLSSLGLFGSGKIGPAVTVTTIGLAYLAAIVFKLGVVALAGEFRLLKRWGAVLVAPGAALAAGLLLFGGK